MNPGQPIAASRAWLGVALCLLGVCPRTAMADPFDFIQIANPDRGGSGFRLRQLFVGPVVARDPNTGQPLQFVHVDLGVASGGNGTFERPYSGLEGALAGAQQGDIIYVRGGASGTMPGFTVPPGVRVFSSGPQQAISVSQRPDADLPSSGTGVYPKVLGTVTISSNSTISGFDIATDTGAGISGTDVTGTVDVSGNIVRTAGAGSSGIQILNSTGDLTLRIADNQVSGGKNSGIQVKSDGTARITATVTGNRVSNNVGSGIFFFLSRGRVNATISNNTTRENQAVSPQEGGIRFGVFSDAQGTVTLAQNTSQGNVGHGIFVGSQGISQANATIRDNTTTGNTGNGIFLGANENGAVAGHITGNTSTNNLVNAAFAPFPTGSGIFVGAQVNGKAVVVVENNTTRSNADIGIFTFVAQNGSATYHIQGNTSEANTRNGIEVNVGLNGAPGTPPRPGDMPEATAVVTGNTVTGNLGIGPPLGGGGIFVLAFNSALVRALVQNNTIQGNAQSQGAFGGMALVAVQNAQIQSTVRSNTYSGNGGANPSFTALTGVPPTVLGGALAGPSQICLRLANNTSDSGYALVRPAGTTLRAETTDNVGQVVTPAAPVDPLGDCPVP